MLLTGSSYDNRHYRRQIKLTVVVMEDFPQLQSLSKYELYNMGRSQYAGLKVASAQTHEDDKEEEAQTDEVSAQRSWLRPVHPHTAHIPVQSVSESLLAGRPYLLHYWDKSCFCRLAHLPRRSTLASTDARSLTIAIRCLMASGP